MIASLPAGRRDYIYRLVQPYTWLLAGAFLLALFLVRVAWCSEDAYIGFRVVENFLHGQGLTWNVGERVQIYTDPLFEFLLVIPTWISGSAYGSSMFISLLLSLGAYAFLMAQRSAAVILAGTVLLLTSKGFMDFSVSGLENPGTHLAIAAYAWVYWRNRNPFWLSLIASLAAINRMDSVLLFAPSLVWLYIRHGSRVIQPMLRGTIPFFAWELFAVFYYGFPFPNTAYAKLNTGIPATDLVRQGLNYLENAAVWDTVTAVVIVAGVVIGFLHEDGPLSLGVLLSVLYVVRVGGDYMTGRFLTPAFVLCFAIVIQHFPKRGGYVIAACAAALLLGLRIPHPPLLATSNFGVATAGQLEQYLGVGDERLFWYPASGLLRWRPDKRWPDFPWRDIGLKLHDSGTRFTELQVVGMIPYFAGPNVYVYDQGALGDALTARLKMTPGPWRTGHYWREAPAGYVETLKTGVNQIKDRELSEFYDHLRLITRGNLWDPRRLLEIVRMNTGYYNRLLR